MPVIELKTTIKSCVEICFDLSRSIDLHQVSTVQTKESAIDGKTSGLINLGEYVTWQATHLGIKQKLTSKITAFERPFYFRDEQQRGAFKYIVHDHYFETEGDKVIMKDIFRFQSPFGYIGWLFEKFFLINYLKRLLINRNNVIKEYAETGKWKLILEERKEVFPNREM